MKTIKFQGREYGFKETRIESCIHCDLRALLPPDIPVQLIPFRCKKACKNMPAGVFKLIQYRCPECGSNRIAVSGTEWMPNQRRTTSIPKLRDSGWHCLRCGNNITPKRSIE